MPSRKSVDIHSHSFAREGLRIHQLDAVACQMPGWIEWANLALGLVGAVGTAGVAIPVVGNESLPHATMIP
jgi:hypothetical protein